MKYRLIRHFILAFILCLTIIVVLISLKKNHLMATTQTRRSNSNQSQERPPSEYRRPSPQSTAKPQERSKPSCCSFASQHKLEMLCPTNESVSVISNCTCTDYMKCKLVIVTALSSNHFPESVDFFGSVYAELPRTKFIVYDLGLTAEHLRTIQSYCNVKEVRKFNFDQYPEHTTSLFLYAWKPFIINEISQEYELFFYCDSSCRMTNTFIPFLPNLLKFPLICPHRLNSTVIRYTHQGMLDYLGVNMTRTEMNEILPQSFQGGVLIVWVTDLFKNKILLPWVDCAKHVDCLAPKGSKRGGCDHNRRPMTAYVGCHRYDQSALNVLLIREFGASLNTIFNDKDGIPFKRLVTVAHSPTKDYDNLMSYECNIKYVSDFRLLYLLVCLWSIICGCLFICVRLSK